MTWWTAWATLAFVGVALWLALLAGLAVGCLCWLGQHLAAWLRRR